MAISNIITRIVVAEFDIDKGSCIRTQYPPAPPSADDGYIAEQLLPDGSEKHALGRSFVVLGHRTPLSSFSVPAHFVKDSSVENESGEGSSFADFTTPPQLEDILTIDSNFICIRRLGEELFRVEHGEGGIGLERRQVPANWEGLVAGVTLRFSRRLPSSSEPAGSIEWANSAPHVCGEEERADLFVAPSAVDQLKRLIDEYRIDSRGNVANETSQNSNFSYPVPLFALAATMTKKDSSVRRGGITKGVAFIGPDLVQLSALWPAVEHLVKQCCDVKGSDTEAIGTQFELIKSLYLTIASEICSLADGDVLSKEIAQAAVQQPVNRSLESPFTGDSSSRWLALRAFGEGQLPTVRIHNPNICPEPLFIPPPNAPVWFIQLNTFGVAEVVAAFKENFASILTALLCGRRIVIKGFGCPSTVVAEAALAVGIIGSCIVPDFITSCVFPYSSITYMDKFLELGSPYVVGTLNPMYDSRSEWWDLLCDLDTGAVTAGISTRMLTVEAAHVEDDKDFCRQLMQYLASTGGYLGHSRGCVEHGVRERIAEYVSTIMATAAHAEHTNRMPAAIKKLLETNHRRLMLTQLGGMYDIFVDKHLGGGDIGRVEMQLAVAALRRNDTSSDDDIIQALQTILRRVDSGTNGPHNLVSILPQSMGGVGPIANQLMNSHMAIRVVALEVLSRLESIPFGKKAMCCLNSFVLLSYEQMRADMSSLRIFSRIVANVGLYLFEMINQSIKNKQTHKRNIITLKLCIDESNWYEGKVHTTTNSYIVCNRRHATASKPTIIRLSTFYNSKRMPLGNLDLDVDMHRHSVNLQIDHYNSILDEIRVCDFQLNKEDKREVGNLTGAFDHRITFLEKKLETLKESLSIVEGELLAAEGIAHELECQKNQAENVFQICAVELKERYIKARERLAASFEATQSTSLKRLTSQSEALQLVLAEQEYELSWLREVINAARICAGSSLNRTSVLSTTSKVALPVASCAIPVPSGRLRRLIGPSGDGLHQLRERHFVSCRTVADNYQGSVVIELQGHINGVRFCANEIALRLK